MRVTSGFEHRRALYQRFDREFSSRTGFFAAAALTNSVFCSLFRLRPRVVSRGSFAFLNELGASLEVVNVNWGRRIRCSSVGGEPLDLQLVLTEQKAAQRFWEAFHATSAIPCGQVRGELNDLLNGRHIASRAAPFFTHTRALQTVLRRVRGSLGVALDFAHEGHRVHVGCALIEHMRGEVERRS